jgi:hypothetical protein
MERRDMTRDAGVMMTNLDLRADFESQRPQPEGDQILVQIRPKEDHTVNIGANLPLVIKGRLIELLKLNKDLFDWEMSSSRDKVGMYPGGSEKKEDGSRENSGHQKASKRTP